MITTSAELGSVYRAHHRVWPSRLPQAIEPPRTALPHNLLTSAQRYGPKTALAFFGATISYDALLERVERLASWLQSLGVNTGDRIILCMQNCPQLVIAHFAILRANAVVVPVNPMNKAIELSHYISDAQARVCITTADLAGEWAAASDMLEAAEGLRHVLVTHFTDEFTPQRSGPHAIPDSWYAWLTARPSLRAPQGAQLHDWQAANQHARSPGPVLVGVNDLAVLPYTSGTTGLPKGCMHLHRSLMHNAQATA